MKKFQTKQNCQNSKRKKKKRILEGYPSKLDTGL